jgi:hypothetical protein
MMRLLNHITLASGADAGIAVQAPCAGEARVVASGRLGQTFLIVGLP